MEKARHIISNGILIIIVAVFTVIVLAASTHASYAMGDQEYKITINTLKDNPYAGKYGTGFRKYSGTEFSEYGEDIWYYNFGHGKLFISTDPNHYEGGSGFYYWTSENDPDSIWGTYASPVDTSTGEYLTSYHEGYDKGYSFFYTGGNMADIDFDGHVEATLAYADVELDKKSFTYTGSEIKPQVTVKLDGTSLTEGIDYDIKYEYNIKVELDEEIPTVIITSEDLGDPYNPELDARVIYEKRIPFKILKADHPGIKATAKTAAVKYKKVKSKTQTVSMSQAVNVTGRKGTLKYTVSPVGAKAKKALTYKNGRIYVKKGTKKGLYKFKVTVMDRGGRNYKASAKKTITAKIRVK